MSSEPNRWIQHRVLILMTLILAGCGRTAGTDNSGKGFEVKFLVGSALTDFCEQAAVDFNQSSPRLDSGEAFYLSCESVGSGDVVETVVSQAEQLQQDILAADLPEFPTLLSVDGEIYQSQLIYRMEQVFPGQRYIPAITDSPLLANSPMVFMNPQLYLSKIPRTPRH